MFTSLRSRLWLTYSLISAAALTVVALVLLALLLTSPSVFRQASARMSLTEGEAIELLNQAQLQTLQVDVVEPRLRQIGNPFSTRLLIFSTSHQLLVDTMRSEATLALPRFPRLRPASATRDGNGNLWLYSLTRLRNGDWLMVATPRPNVSVFVILGDQFFLSIIQAAVVSLVLSLLLSFWVARWVANPVQRLVNASHQLPGRAVPPLREEGPREVKELVRAFNDMTARVQASQESQRDFVANVSHEMKTPLTSIQGFAQAILDGTADTPEELDQAAGIIYSESGRLHRLVLDLLDLARLDAGTANLKHEQVDISSLLGNIDEKFALQAQKAGVNISVKSAQLPLIPGDGDRLAQVLTNLVDNALHHTQPGGTVTLSDLLEPDWLVIQVSDDGEGIPPEILPHIFDRFYRGDPSRSNGQDHGAGLGLAIAREIVLAHHGTITAQSVPGQGSIFTVRLPLVMPAPAAVSRRTK